MKNRKYIILSLFVSIVMLLSACYNFGGNNNGEQNNILQIGTSEDIAGGIHIYNIEDTIYSIVSGASNTEYQIIYPASYDLDELFATNEIASWIFSATGVNIETRSDAELVYSQTAKYISIGETALIQSAGVTVDQSVLGDKGFIIKTSGRSVFIAGATALGTVNGAYKFLELTIGLATYGPECTVYHNNITNIALKNYDIVDVPDIMYNVAAMGFIDETLRKRMQFSQHGWLEINNSGNYHNSFAYLPKSSYLATHPEWYSDDGTQLCYTAHGDEKSFEIMVSTVIDVLKSHLMVNLTSKMVTFSQEDTFTWCTCENCSSLRQTYETDSVSVIYFLNRVSDELQDWFESSDGSAYARDFDICFFAYNRTEKPPVVFDNALGQYVVIDDSVNLNDNVCVLYAPIAANYHESFYTEENEEYYENMKGWSAVSKKLYMWTYSTNFHFYLAPYNSFSGISGTYKSLKETGTYYLFDQNQYNNGSSTGFTILKAYLSSKLAWNVNENVENLIDKFFTNYYGVASEDMRKCFEALRTQFAYMEDVLNFSGDVFEPPLSKDLYPKGFLTTCLGYIDDAYQNIEYLNDKDRGEYDRVKKAIMLESLSFRYLLIEIYGSEYNTLILDQMKRDFRTDSQKTGVGRIAEHTYTTSLFASWGI